MMTCGPAVTLTLASASATISPPGLRALVIEGGGMRGAHSAGVMNSLYQAGIRFDILCGSSAGSGNAVYWVDGNYKDFHRGWVNDLDGNKFINFWNKLLGRPIMNMDYLIHDFYKNIWPLDIEAINRASTLSEASMRLYIAVTDCETGKPDYITNEPGTDILGALRAGSAMPVAYPLPVEYRYRDQDRLLADGGIADSIPVQKAIDEGAQEVWVILTRPKGYRKKPDRITPLLIPRTCSKYPKLAAAIRRRHEMYNKQLDLVESLESAGKQVDRSEARVKIRVIRPTPDLPISRFTRDSAWLLKAVEAGEADGRAVLKQYGYKV